MAVARKLLFPGVFKPFDGSQASTPGVQQILLNETVTTGKTWRFLKVSLDHKFFTSWDLTAGGILVASGQLGSGYPKDFFEWASGRDFVAGTNLLLKALVNLNSPVDQIRYHIEAREF